MHLSKRYGFDFIFLNIQYILNFFIEKKKRKLFSFQVKEIGSTIKRQTSKINQDINGFVLTPTKRSENKENMQPELATSKLTAHKSPSFAGEHSSNKDFLFFEGKKRFLDFFFLKFVNKLKLFDTFFSLKNTLSFKRQKRTPMTF